MQTQPISVVIVALDAATQIEACLKSASFAEEIVVVDSGSSDETVEIALEYGARVVHQEWLGFGPQKQFAVNLARHDWVLCLDADERVSPELRDSILDMLRSPGARAYRIARSNRFMGRFLRHGEGYPDWCLRLFDRRLAHWSDDAVHEKVLTDVAVDTLRGDLFHESAEDISAYLEKQNRYTSLQAATMYRCGRKAHVGHLVFSPTVRFLRFYLLRLGMLDGVPGLVHIAIGCGSSFLKYAKLIALQRGK